ncbi:hypothetical protein AM499_05025 [Bacillus sp. FJAT-22090]|uniref:hypothetical protein n=1 Tax=Bacillus sp. FJAT-22090 TaxID=1581038 RepID=UPI0006B0181B|nr:hypothetical protein [Bacillus sp. FJAT-22090]ALC85249.1 hypothetical protein AM499_05025 [Bacillus sp. FJAT-22090]
MQKKGTLLLTTLTIIVLLSGCIDTVENSDKLDEKNASKQLIEEKEIQIRELEEKNEELQDTLSSIETDFKYTKEEADYYNQLIDDLISDYSETQLKDLAKKLWDYELEVNGLAIPRDGIVEVQNNTIEISLIQRQPAYVVLPDDIFMQGKISGNYNEHLKFNTNPSETYFTDGTVVTGVHHKFIDVEKGATISFSITEELKISLGLDTSEITIKNS